MTEGVRMPTSRIGVGPAAVNPRDEITHFGAIEKIHRQMDQPGEDVHADVVDHALTGPCQAVRGKVTGKTSRHSKERQEQGYAEELYERI